MNSEAETRLLYLRSSESVNEYKVGSVNANSKDFGSSLLRDAPFIGKIESCYRFYRSL